MERFLLTAIFILSPLTPPRVLLLIFNHVGNDGADAIRRFPGRHAERAETAAAKKGGTKGKASGGG